MRTSTLFHLTRGTLLASLLLLTACDRVVDPGGNTEAVLFRFDQANVTENVLSGAIETTGTFTASGAVIDQGRYEEVLAIGKTRIYGYQHLFGQRGTVVMQITGLVLDDRQRGRIQVTIRRGTGSYAELSGTETVEIELAPGASPLETMNTFTAKLGQE